MALMLELPSQEAQTAFNLHRWSALLANPEVAKWEGRVETNRFGYIVMSPPPSPGHGSLQIEIGFLLRTQLPDGRVISECPISTAEGVKAADVAWASPERMRELGDKPCFPRAPEICVEVVSPSNSTEELREKMALYFDAGAQEVWLCSPNGAMTFFAAHSADSLAASRLCPRFPNHVELK